MRKDLLLKILILLIIGFVLFAKGSIVLHEYGHDVIKISESDSHDEEDCLLCEFAKISSKIFLSVVVGVLTFAVYLINIISRLDRLKLSYFLSSKLSRGPPAII